MKILAIETSCDDTGVALVEATGDLATPTFTILSNQVQSQVREHQEYGGVYPNLAKELHSKNLVSLLKKVLGEVNMLHQIKKPQDHSNVLENIGMILEREPELFTQFKEYLPTIEAPPVDAIAVTQGPGLEPALWVGLNFAKVLSLFWDIPLIPVNHMEGHIVSALYENDTPLTFPALALLVSGGHTQLVLIERWGAYNIIGQTRDDAVGEAFDKVARMLELPYPGGPEISKLAETARKESSKSSIKLPRPMIDSDDYDFSFAGLKTAVLYELKKIPELDQKTKQVFAREFENAVVDVLIHKTKKALRNFNAQTLIAAGGVTANTTLRNALESLPVPLLIPDQALTTDNAAMIGMAAYMHKDNPAKDPKNLKAMGNMSLESSS